MPKTMDTRSHDELRAAVLAGEEITPEQLSTARERDELLRLHAEAEQLRADEAAEVEHERRLTELKEKIEALPTGAQELYALAEEITEKLVKLVGMADRRAKDMTELAHILAQLGVPELQYASGQPKHHSGMGWKRDAATYGAPLIVIGERRMRPANPYRLIDRIAADARVQAGLKSREPGVTNPTAPPSLAQQLAAMDHSPAPKPDPVPVRWLSGRKTGQIEYIDPSHAAHWVERRHAAYAEVG